MPKPQGYDYFDNIPLADISEQRWANVIGACSPLLRGVARVGISATQAGVEQAQSKAATEIVASGTLLNDAGEINPELSQELGLRHSPRADHLELALAGLHIVSAAVRATELFHDYPVENEDYTGQTGIRFVRRTTLASARDIEQSKTLGHTLNTNAVRNLQARIFTDPTSKYQDQTELTFAASLYGGYRPRSISTVLHATSSEEQGIASAHITAGERQGDFVSSASYVNFSDLGQYAGAIAGLRIPSDARPGN